VRAGGLLLASAVANLARLSGVSYAEHVRALLDIDEAGGRADNHGVKVGSVAAGMAARFEIGSGGQKARVRR
jgi:hypothetical protein